VKALVRHAHAVADNDSVDVLPKFGLRPGVLGALKPQLVTLSMSAFGSDSPWRKCRAYGSTLEQASGLPLLVGHEGEMPVTSHPTYGDPIDQRTARENIAQLCDPDSFIEYGPLAIAAQRRRRALDDLIRNTPADGLIAGLVARGLYLARMRFT
jgi:hypothetical protein